MRRIAVIALAGLTIVGFAACQSASVEDYSREAENFIEDSDGELAEQVQQTFTDASCTEPANTDEGAQFNCTATNASGETWAFVGEVGGKNQVLVSAVGPTASGGEPTGSAPATTTGSS
jgi:hypothetical protein